MVLPDSNTHYNWNSIMPFSGVLTLVSFPLNVFQLPDLLTYLNLGTSLVQLLFTLFWNGLDLPLLTTKCSGYTKFIHYLDYLCIVPSGTKIPATW